MRPAGTSRNIAIASSIRLDGRHPLPGYPPSNNVFYCGLHDRGQAPGTETPLHARQGEKPGEKDIIAVLSGIVLQCGNGDYQSSKCMSVGHIVDAVTWCIPMIFAGKWKTLILNNNDQDPYAYLSDWIEPGLID